jgi:hypothetical protein
VGEAGKLLGEGWTRAANGTFGELTLAVLAGASTPNSFATAWAVGSSGWTNAAATGWGGRHWELWKRGDERAVLLDTLWGQRQGGAGVRGGARCRPHLRVPAGRGRALAVVAGIPADGTDALLDALLRAATGGKVS